MNKKYLFFILLTLCLGFGVAAQFFNNTNPPMHERPHLSHFFNTPRFYAWSELLSDVASDHGGGLIFQAQGGRMYSVAWRSSGSLTPHWPKVEGTGIINGKTVTIIYRHAGGDPHHEFYHALATYTFNNNGSGFTCDFKQQVSESEQQRSQGKASGILITAQELITDSFDRDKITSSFSKWITRAHASKLGPGSCPVIPDRLGKADLQSEYEGTVYSFCCPSCLEAFSTQPKDYLR